MSEMIDPDLEKLFEEVIEQIQVDLYNKVPLENLYDQFKERLKTVSIFTPSNCIKSWTLNFFFYYPGT
jgi:hypothetical protein